MSYKVGEVVTVLCVQGIIQDEGDLGTVYFILDQAKQSDDPIWRKDLSPIWENHKIGTGRSPEGVGIRTNLILEAVGKLIGREFVYDYIDKAGRIQGGRIVLPKDMPANFVSGVGCLKAA